MYGLIDCNNFYVSCERVFNPALNDRPVLVLSNNDGYIIACSNEAKRLGVKRRPVYQFKKEIELYNMAVFSSNYTLYGDMSTRVMSVLSTMVPDIEVYSIDEAFISFAGFDDPLSLGREIVRRVSKSTGIPVSLGIAPTKTLSKIANRFAKKYPAYNNVCIIDDEEKRIKALKLTPVGDVWGIGRGVSKRLLSRGIETAYDFTNLPQDWVRKNMTVVGERTWSELRGIPCIEMECTPPSKKQICISRSFGKMITDPINLSEAIATHAAACARKLRDQKAYAVSMMIFIHTNNFRSDQPQYYKNAIINFPVPTSDSTEIVKAAVEALRRIYLEGYLYKKAGVIITELTKNVQLNIFDTVDREKRARLMEAIDHINDKYRAQLKIATQGNGRDWKLKQEQLSPAYTTNLNDIIQIK